MSHHLGHLPRICPFCRFLPPPPDALVALDALGEGVVEHGRRGQWYDPTWIRGRFAARALRGVVGAMSMTGYRTLAGEFVLLDQGTPLERWER